MIRPDALESVLAALGGALAERGFAFEIAIIGGSDMLLQGFIKRPTKDVDVVAVVIDGDLRSPKPLPAELVTAARDVGRAYGLGDGWLNAGPSDLFDFGLPDGFFGRCETHTYRGLTVHAAGRYDLIALKLFASTDVLRMDIDDLRAMSPTPDELLEVAVWVLAHKLRRFRFDVVFLLEQLGVDDAEHRVP